MERLKDTHKHRQYLRDCWGRFMTEGKSERIWIRCTKHDRKLIEEAADAQEKTVTAFVLEATMHAITDNG